MKRVVKVFAILALVFVTGIILMFALEDYFFTKSDARAILKEDGIEISDNFSILSNHTSGMNDVSVEFTLKINEDDKAKIINTIKNSQYFNDTLASKLNFWLADRSATKKLFPDGLGRHSYIRETYEKTDGYQSVHDIISVSLTNDSLSFLSIGE